MGDGPFYVFYTPFHHIQIASTIGRAVIHRDPTVAPIGGPVCEVVAVAKRDLKAGERLDGIGGFCTYGMSVLLRPVRRLGGTCRRTKA
jgi:predicted homoserine dehydrogenase-like protein